MRKLLYLLSLLLIFQLPAFTQTTVINEDFEDDLTGWEFEGNWFHEPGYIFLYYHPITLDYDFWVTSPEFEVPATGGDLIINHFIDVYAVNVTNEKCEISVIYDGQEDVVWEHDLSDGSWGDIFGTDMLIPLDEFLGETVQLKFRSYGAKSNALWGWFIFNLNLTTFFNHDLAALEMVGPGNIDPGQEGNWMLNVKTLACNLQLTSTSNFTVTKKLVILQKVLFQVRSLPVKPVRFPFHGQRMKCTILYFTLLLKMIMISSSVITNLKAIS